MTRDGHLHVYCVAKGSIIIIKYDSVVSYGGGCQWVASTVNYSLNFGRSLKRPQQNLSGRWQEGSFFQSDDISPERTDGNK